MHIVVLGTGISALLLADALVRRQCYESLLLVGPRRPPLAHRLSYWSAEPTPFDAYNDASWSSLRVTDAAACHIPVALSRLSYRTFRSRDWANAALARILAAPRVRLVDARAEHIAQEDAAAIVHAGGAAFRADWVFSSAHLCATPERWQRFLGWEVELKEERLDTTTATLLDFRTPSAGDFRFLYQLPLGPKRLFVEHVSYQPCAHAVELQRYLDEVLGLRDWRVVDREAGATPLFRNRPVRVRGRVVHIGVGGGLAKTATGYAVIRMWRDAEQFASALASVGRPVFRERVPFLCRLADRFFLDLLARVPERIPSFMGALFSRARGDAVLSFLDDRARLAERLSVALSMPGWLRWWLLQKL